MLKFSQPLADLSKQSDESKTYFGMDVWGQPGSIMDGLDELDL